MHDLQHTPRTSIELIAASREEVERGPRVRGRYVLISIRDPGRSPVRFRRPQRCLGVLELIFHDAEPVSGFTPLEPITQMSEEDAWAIWRFVDEHAQRVAAIVVHCEQGMSRSPAVAAAIAQSLGQDPRRFFRDHQPNQYVYDLMMEGRDQV